MSADLDDILNIEEGLNALSFAAGAGHLKMLMYIAMKGDEAMMDMTMGDGENSMFGKLGRAYRRCEVSLGGARRGCRG